MHRIILQCYKRESAAPLYERHAVPCYHGDEGPLKLDAIGFGSLNLDEFWEVDRRFLGSYGLEPGEEYVRDVEWFRSVYPALKAAGDLKAVDPGGSAPNMIAALRRMGFLTGFYGAAGEQDAAALRLHELGERDHLRVEQADIPAGRCLALIDREDPAKDRALVILPNANDLAGSNEPPCDYFQQASWLHLTSFVSGAPLGAQVRLLERLSPEVLVSFDPGAVYTVRGYRELLPILVRTSVLFVAVEELQALTGLSEAEAGVDMVRECGVPTVVVKMGAKGLRAFHGDQALYQPAVAPRTILDRTGAGDVAAAGFIAGRIRSLSVEKSLELAAIAASRSIEGYGRSCYPDAGLLESFLTACRTSAM